MGRAQFIRNVEDLYAVESIPNIKDIKRGSEEDLSFTYINGDEKIKCTVLFPDLDDYPNGYQVFIYSESDISKTVVDELGKINYVDFPLKQLLQRIVSIFASSASSPDRNSVSDENGDMEMLSGSDMDLDEDGSEEEEEEEDDDGGWSDDDALFSDGSRAPTSKFNPTTPAPKFSPDTIRNDLLKVKKAGFRVATFGSPENSHFTVAISIRIRKLGLSQEAIAAWEMDPSQYLMLLIRYEDVYRDMTALVDTKNAVTFRIGVTDRIKPEPSDVTKAFATNSDESRATIKSFFLAGSLQNLMENFIILAKFRVFNNMTWDGAEKHFEDCLREELQPLEAHAKTTIPEGSEISSAMPRIVQADCLKGIADVEKRKKVSMPLLAMQFLLRRFIHCTKFCTVCHKRIYAEFSALLPYVCSNDLCLFRHVNMARDDIVERTLASKPSVVDLLVSFCYTACVTNSLNSFPRGLDLKIPIVAGVNCTYTWETYECRIAKASDLLEYQIQVGSWVTLKLTMMLEDKKTLPIQIQACIEDKQDYPLLKLSRPFCTASYIHTAPGSPQYDAFMFNIGSVQPRPLPTFTGTIHLCGAHLDEMTDSDTRVAITQILRTLPHIDTMAARVAGGASLSNWPYHMLPQAYKLLRWIIASNRSSLIPLGEHEKVTEENTATYGLHTYHQFKWAMGSPDKEEALYQAIKTECSRNAEHPTIFAFHGSPLGNWHSIVREGLNYNRVANGRAYGDGIYHARDMATSLGYSSTPRIHGGYGANFVHATPLAGWDTPRDVHIWPGSRLRIETAISLNEIVNAVTKFRSHSPYYVVQHEQWVQTRYLFIKSSVPLPGVVGAPSSSLPSFPPPNMSSTAASASTTGVNVNIQGQQKKPGATSPSIPYLSQDPLNTPTSNNSKIRIPIAKYFDRCKISTDGSSVKHSIDLTSDTEQSDDELDTFLKKYDKAPESKSTSNSSAYVLPQQHVLPFDPALTNRSHITLLPPPTSASTMTSKTLTKELSTIINIQNSTPLSNLGWYIDENHVDNVYQWIVELHSFPLSLPLAQDLKRSNLQSVLLELRFGKSYPMSPPFIRVIYPRFLPFMQGGGGHVTAGGAICMELLTNSGWSAVSSIESVLLQVKLAIESTEPKPARLERGNSMLTPYSAGEAKEAYIRACRTHGWSVPMDFEEM